MALPITTRKFRFLRPIYEWPFCREPVIFLGHWFVASLDWKHPETTLKTKLHGTNETSKDLLGTALKHDACRIPGTTRYHEVSGLFDCFHNQRVVFGFVGEKWNLFPLPRIQMLEVTTKQGHSSKFKLDSLLGRIVRRVVLKIALGRLLEVLDCFLDIFGDFEASGLNRKKNREKFATQRQQKDILFKVTYRPHYTRWPPIRGRACV